MSVLWLARLARACGACWFSRQLGPARSRRAAVAAAFSVGSPAFRPAVWFFSPGTLFGLSRSELCFVFPRGFAGRAGAGLFAARAGGRLLRFPGFGFVVAVVPF